MRRLPWSLCWFALTGVIFLLQLFPLTGVFLMLVAAPLWSIITVNARERRDYARRWPGLSPASGPQVCTLRYRA